MKKPSTGNPCPFLRALAANGLIEENGMPVGTLAQVIVRAGGPTADEGKLPKSTLSIIALIAGGLGPLKLLQSFRKGVVIAKLREGPLYKKGVSSRIINEDGSINNAELQRLNSFSTDLTDPKTKKNEKGLRLENLKKMMDENFARAKAKRRKIDRALMDGEWPVLLKILGKDEGKNRYLSIAELNALFLEQQLPERILKRFRESV